MYKITLKNKKSFYCNSNTTIFDAAKENGVFLEHSCLTARCRSCAVQIEEGSITEKIDDMVLSNDEKSKRWILSCNSIPTSDIKIDIEDLGEIIIFDKKIVPAKIHTIEKLNDNVIKIILRIPPNSNFGYNSGQYGNISRGQLKRSYSIANGFKENGFLMFFIKQYENGLMSKYWFDDARVGDLLQVEGPLGSFFLRENEMENIIFLATGTGVAPVKAILEGISEKTQKFTNTTFWFLTGARNEKDLFWAPNEFISVLNLKYIPVLSNGSDNWIGERGYVQDVLIKQNIPLSNAQVYACGSNKMIESAKKTLIENGLDNKYFFSDAFVATN
jgi:CDP-4-dehydro-6-deoxyglucose reductase